MTDLHSMLIGMLVEHILLVGILTLVSVELLSRSLREPIILTLFFVLGAWFASVWLYGQGYTAEPFAGEFSVDGQASMAKAIVLGLTLPVLLGMRKQGFDYRSAILLLSSLYGACLLLSAQSLIMVFLALEIISLPLYALIVYTSTHPQRAEAALKYLVLGSVGTASLLMGIVWLLGTTGSLSITAFAQALQGDGLAMNIAAVLVFLGLLLKLALVPFHTWAPDAYEGANAMLTAYMATVIKAAMLLFIVRLFGDMGLSPELAGLVVMVALVSILWGNLAAMRQTGIKRLIAYSSIAHAGYVMLALFGDASVWYTTIAFYLLVYGVATLLVFVCLPRTKDGKILDHVKDLKGLFYQRPWAALMIGLAMLSLAGLPPLPGFVAKFYIFQNLMEQGLVLYAVTGLAFSYIGLYFYLRIIQFMFMGEQRADQAENLQAIQDKAPVRELAREYPLHRLAYMMCLGVLLALMLLPGFVMAWLS